MKNFIQNGVNLSVTAPYAVAAGEGVLIGNLFGVAASAAQNGAEVDIVTEGVFALAKPSAAIFVVGSPVYFDSGTKTVRSGGDEDSNSAGDSECLCGVCVKAAGAGELTVNVKLASSPALSLV